MIRRLEFANFKSWAAPEPLALRPITGLFGSNSSGKTSVLQVLLLLKQTAESLDRSRVLHLGDERSLIDLGTYFDVVYAHETDRRLEFSVCWNLLEPLEVEDPSKKQATILSSMQMEFSTVVREVRGGDAPRLVVEEFTYKIDGASFGMRRRPEKEDEDDRYDLVSDGLSLKRRRGRPWPLPSPIKSYAFPDQVSNYFQNADFLDDLALEFEELMADIYYVGPLRENPHRSYVWGGERPSDVGSRGEQAIEALLAARAEGRKIGRGSGKGRRYVKFEVRIAEWLQEMGLIDAFSVRAIGRNRKEHEVRVRKTSASPEVLIPDVGFGVSQVLPVLVQCYYAPEGSVVLFEQPEIHLHPRVQASLADVFIDASREQGVQIVVESHSEHLVRRLQRRIAEGATDPDDVALYFTTIDEGGSDIERLDVDSRGNVRNWPPDFFGDQLSELAAMTKAAANRAG